MPRLSYFYGISIYLYYEDHPPPHVHARYGEHQAKVSIANARIMDGSLPPRAVRLVTEWVNTHRNELNASWGRATRGEDPSIIEGLR